MCTLKVDASIPKDDQKYVARHLSPIETQKAGERRFVFLPLSLSVKARLSKPAVCNQSLQIRRPTTGINPPVFEEEEEESRSDGWHHARNESGVQGSTERKGMQE
jgi:hypothetical protein